MRFAWICAGMLLGAGLFGCGSTALPESSPDPTTTPPPNKGGAISFGISGVLELSPGEKRALDVFVTPADDYEVHFVLLSAPEGASLSALSAWTDEDGHASVKLDAPDVPASFKLRAWIEDGPAAEIQVSVSAQGFGSIRVEPAYGGARTITEWIASVTVGATCKDVAPSLPGEPDGALVAVASVPEVPVVQSVPVGPTVAVSVRAGYFAWGCKDTASLVAGDAVGVTVPISDVPVDVERTSLDTTFTYAPETSPYSKILSAASALLVDELIPEGEDEAALLLDAMALEAPDPTTFGDAADSLGWLAFVEAQLAKMPTPLRDRAATWIEKGWNTADPTMMARLEGVEGVPGKAVLRVTSLAGFDASTAGIPETHVIDFGAGSLDAASIAGTVYWLPSRLAGAACLRGAVTELGAQPNVSAALAKVVGCGDLAQSLGSVGACDEACLADVCRTALATRWKHAVDAAVAKGPIGTIGFGASGVVKVDDYAMPIAMKASWIGTVSDGEIDASVTGDMIGVLSDDAIPNEPPQ